MKKMMAPILLGFLALTLARADIPLTIGYYGAVPCCGGPCWDDELPGTAASAQGTFTLNGVPGIGTVTSGTITTVDNLHGQQHTKYAYTVDMSNMSTPSSHCIRVVVHFGAPHTCSTDVLVYTNTGSIAVTSASRAPFGDITFVFGGGCLAPGQAANSFQMLSDVPSKNGSITIIDDYKDPASGQTNESRIQVTAIVPDIPPNWAYAPQPIPTVFFQGNLDLVGTNQYTTNVPITPASNGMYDFRLQLVDYVSNGLPVSGVVTQTVPVISGLFNMPLPFDPVLFTGGVRSLSIGVKPSGAGGQFTQLLPAVQVAPTAQAYYAYSAGVVSDISPSQAVLSLNGITGNANLVGGQGIQVSLNGDGRSILISSVGSPSDRNIKTDFADVEPQSILSKVAALPIQSWRYTNEPPEIRHLGPMAQDFMAAFGLGADNKTIGNVDEGGVALTAIQALNAQLEKKDAEIRALESRLQKLEQRLEEKAADK